MTMVPAIELATIHCVEIPSESVGGTKFEIDAWRKKVLDFCSLIENHSRGEIQIGHVRMKFDLTKSTHEAWRTEDVQEGTLPEVLLGKTAHKGINAKHVSEALCSFAYTDITSLNLRFGEGGLVTIWKAGNHIKIATRNIPLLGP